MIIPRYIYSPPYQSTQMPSFLIPFLPLLLLSAQIHFFSRPLLFHLSSLFSFRLVAPALWSAVGWSALLCDARKAWSSSSAWQQEPGLPASPRGIAPHVPFGTNFFVFQKKPTSDSPQVWWWWWWGSGQRKWPALFLIPKAWRNGATQKLPLNH